MAEAYLKYLYRPAAQDIIGQAPLSARATRRRRHATPPSSPRSQLVTIADFGGWPKAQKTHFADGGVFDQIYKAA